jgi:hypothetical protein
MEVAEFPQAPQWLAQRIAADGRFPLAVVYTMYRALTGQEPTQGQYLTVVSSAAPELLEIRGRELVDLIAAQLTERLGAAEVLWSRVSREPEATIAVRPGTERPNAVREGVALAGAWLEPPWPPTMESAVRSGRAAASMLSDMATKVAA